MQVHISFIKGAIRQDHRPVNFQNHKVRVYGNEIKNTDLYLAKVK
jgi:hypothetical protein